MTSERREVLEILAELSDLHPEMRMGQWLTMFASMARGSTVEAIYDAEDDEMLPAMRRFLDSRRVALQTEATAVA